MATRRKLTEIVALFRANGVKGGPSGDPRTVAAVVDTWEQVFASVPDPDIATAAMAFLCDPEVCQWWPQPGILLARLPGRREALVDDADEAWGEVVAMVGRVGSYGTPKFGADERGQAIARAVDALGTWRDLCYRLGVDTEATYRASFRGAYRAQRQRARMAGADRLALEVSGHPRMLEVDDAS